MFHSSDYLQKNDYKKTASPTTQMKKANTLFRIYLKATSPVDAQASLPGPRFHRTFATWPAYPGRSCLGIHNRSPLVNLFKSFLPLGDQLGDKGNITRCPIFWWSFTSYKYRQQSFPSASLPDARAIPCLHLLAVRNSRQHTPEGELYPAMIQVGDTLRSRTA